MSVRMLVLLAVLVVLPAQAKTFKIATISPDGLSWMKKLRAGAEEVEARTSGRVKFKIYPGGVQGDDATVLRKIKIGQLQGGAVTASALTRFYPDLQIYNLPLTFRNDEEVDYVRERMDQRIIDGLDAAGIVSFSLIETGFAYILTTKPVRSVADLQMLKAWVPDGDPVSEHLIKSFGLSPIPLTLPDVLAGLQTGLIDAVAAPPIVALALQWHNHVKYLLDLPLIYIYSMMMLNKEAFESIDPADQVIVRNVLNRVFAEVDAENRVDNKAAYKALIGQGLEVVGPDAQQLVDWRNQAAQSIQQLEDAGQLSAGSLTLLNRYLAEVRSMSGEDKSPTGE